MMQLVVALSIAIGWFVLNRYLMWRAWRTVGRSPRGCSDNLTAYQLCLLAAQGVVRRVK